MYPSNRILLFPAVLEGGGAINTVEATTDVFDNPREPKAPAGNLPTPAPQRQKTVVPPTFSKDKVLNFEDEGTDETPPVKVEEKKEEKVAEKAPSLEIPPVKVPVLTEVEETEEVIPQKETPPPLLEGIKPPAPKGQGTVQRDYAGYSADEQAVLKQMSNPAFEFTSKLIKKAKELEPLKDAHYLQTEDGYMLTPEYKSLAADAYYAETEGQYLMQCLEQIGLGNKWRPMTGWTKAGEPIFGPEREPTAIEAEKIRVDLSKISGIAQQAQAKMQVLPQQFRQRIQQDNQMIQQEQEKLFEWVKNPAILDSKVPVGGGVEHTIREMKENVKSMFPSYHRNSVGVEAASNLFVALKIYAAEIMDLRKQLEVTTIKKEEAINQEPKGDKKTGTNLKKGKVFEIDDSEPL